MKSLADIIRTSPVRVLPGRYVVAKVPADAEVKASYFMVTHDAAETTVIMEQSNLPLPDMLGVEPDYRLIELRISAPFQGVGFLATVSNAIATAGLNILIVSTFSRDYILLKDCDVACGLDALIAVGFSVIDT